MPALISCSLRPLISSFACSSSVFTVLRSLHSKTPATDISPQIFSALSLNITSSFFVVSRITVSRAAFADFGKSQWICFFHSAMLTCPLGPSMKLLWEMIITTWCQKSSPKDNSNVESMDLKEWFILGRPSLTSKKQLSFPFTRRNSTIPLTCSVSLLSKFQTSNFNSRGQNLLLSRYL